MVESYHPPSFRQYTNLYHVNSVFGDYGCGMVGLVMGVCRYLSKFSESDMYAATIYYRKEFNIQASNYNSTCKVSSSAIFVKTMLLI